MYICESPEPSMINYNRRKAFPTRIEGDSTHREIYTGAQTIRKQVGIIATSSLIWPLNLFTSFDGAPHTVQV